MQGVEVVATATLWGLLSAWLLFPHLGVPLILRRAAAMLLWAELLSLLTWGFGSENCVQRPCAPLAEAGRAAAGTDVPLLSVVVVALAVAYGLRRHRRTGVKRQASPEPGAERGG